MKLLFKIKIHHEHERGSYFMGLFLKYSFMSSFTICNLSIHDNELKTFIVQHFIYFAINYTGVFERSVMMWMKDFAYFRIFHSCFLKKMYHWLWSRSKDCNHMTYVNSDGADNIQSSCFTVFCNWSTKNVIVVLFWDFAIFKLCNRRV